MELRDLQLVLKKQGFYTGLIDNLYGPATADAITAFLAREAPRSYRRWDQNERRVAAFQVMLRMSGIDVGDVDGKEGPQTEYAMGVYDKAVASRDVVIKTNAGGII